MTDAMTSQNIDLSPWVTLYIHQSSILTTLVDANRNSMTNTYWVYTVLRYP